MGANCYRCQGPLKKPSTLRGVLCSSCRYAGDCKKIIARVRDWRTCNRERMRNRESARYAQRKAESIEAYGGKCKECGEGNIIFLCIDHVNNDGAAERRLLRGKVQDIHVWLKREGYPDRYQILCGNCNLKKERIRRKRPEKHSWQKSNAARMSVLNDYGAQCICCKEADTDKLVIDNIHGGGSKEKETYPSRSVYLFLMKRKVDRSRFQVLCANCNQAKEFGPCPHMATVSACARK